MRAIEMQATGDADVLQLVEKPDPVAAPGSLLVEVGAAGVNFIDTYHRTGLYPVSLPYVPGLEGAGAVVAVGDGVEGWTVGDHAAWTAVPGSYAELAVVPAQNAVRVPPAVAVDTAAAAMLQGLTAHYLVDSTWPLAAGQKCLIHAGAGGVGLLLIQMAKLRGAEVFTTVGTEEKAALARGAGADHVVLYRETSFKDAIIELAGEQPLDVVYDGVGQSVFLDSLELIRTRGMMATFGNASGPVEPISPIDMSAGRSLFVTRPALFHYIADRAEFERRSEELFAMIEAGDLDVRIGHEFPLAGAAEAHRHLEGRLTTGKVLLRT